MQQTLDAALRIFILLLPQIDTWRSDASLDRRVVPVEVLQELSVQSAAVTALRGAGVETMAQLQAADLGGVSGLGPKRRVTVAQALEVWEPMAA